MPLSTPIYYSEEETDLLVQLVRNTLKKTSALKPPYDEDAFIYYSDNGTTIICNVSEFRTILKDCNPTKYPEDQGLYDLLHEPLEDMPLYINHPYLKPYAEWRLMVGR
jgi:hypothetical protein